MSEEKGYCINTNQVTDTVACGGVRTDEHSVQKTLVDEFWFVNNTCKQLCMVAKCKLIEHVSDNDVDDIVKDLRESQTKLNLVYNEMRSKFSVSQDIRLTLDRTEEHVSSLISKLIKKSLGHLDAKSSECQSRNSLLSRSSCSSSRRIMLAAQVAALRVEQDAKKIETQKKLEINQLQLELERKRQELEDQRLSVEIKKNEAEINEIDKLTAKNNCSDDVNLAIANPILPTHDQVPTRNVFSQQADQARIEVRDDVSNTISQTQAETRIAFSQQACHGDHNQGDTLTSIMKTFVESVNLSRLPAPEPITFCGDPLKYSTWKASFNALITSRGVVASERIYYLSKYLAGEAKEVVENTFYMNSLEAYEHAFSILDKRYGNSFVVCEAFRHKLDTWPKVSSKDYIALRKFSDFLQQCEVAISHIKGLDILNDCHENRKLLLKLPEWLVQKWSRIVANFQDDELNEGSYPNFCVFSKFIRREADISCNVITSTLNNSRTSTEIIQAKPRAKVLVNSTDENPRQSCALCKKENHDLHTCSIFRKKQPKDRKEFLMKNGLCFGCLCHGHRSKDCKTKSVCSKCKKKHPTCLHGDYEALNPNAEAQKKPHGNNTASSATSSISHRLCRKDKNSKTSMIVPVYLSTLESPDDEVLVYALLDTQSDTTFILEEVGEKLETNSIPTKLRLSTMTSTSTIDCNRFSNLQIRGIHSHETIPLPTTYSREFIPVNRAHIPTSETALKWPHLSRLATEIPSLLPCEVGLLIGYNCSAALAPTNFIIGKHQEPFAQETHLGWCIVGKVEANDESDCDDDEFDEIGISHKVITKKIPDEILCKNKERTEVKFICHNNVKEDIFSEIKTILESDFPERKYENKTMSQEDMQFLDIMKNGIHVNEGGFYEMPLPFKSNGEDKPQLPNNKEMANKRLHYLKKKFVKNPKYFEDYKKFMTDILQSGDAEEVIEEMEPQSVWYIPHHGVYHPKKPNKIRVVFDCSAKFKETSLNDHLLQGPDLMNSLVGILCRFRENPYAVIGDIERMFHQFKVNPSDRDYLRFLWWEDGNLDTKPKIFRMKVHLFGAVSSPGCANYGIKKLASDYKEEFPSSVYDYLTNDFYVDDGLKSCYTENEAIQLVDGARHICSKRNLRLHKFVSNSESVLNSIPDSEKTQTKTCDMLLEDSQIERVLGIQWCIESDEFHFNIKLDNKPMTRRGILSTVASIYDPLGCLAPFTLVGKQILQQMCQENKGWDTPLSDDLKPRWERWIHDLPNLENLKIARCFVPSNFGKIMYREIHHFSDASFTGYGQCSYLRSINSENQVHCSLIIGKARVTPSKVVTIPRLELTAALVSVKVSNMLRTEMKYEENEVFWTDSQIVLGYINNDAKRFHIFVANRVQQIKESSKPEQWKYVNTVDNPADHASRGLTAQELVNSNWFTGPDFLWNPNLPKQEAVDLSIAYNDPEVKRVVLTTVNKNEDIILKKIEKFSSWSTAIKALLCLKKFVKRFHTDTQPIDTVSSNDAVDEKRSLELMIFKKLQERDFATEIQYLKKMNRDNSRKGRFYKLDPFIDANGILRVGGRLRRSSMPFDVKHPIILPRNSHVTNLIIQHYHEKIAHQGRGFTINEIRSNGFWIIGVSKAVASYIYKCVTCRRLRGNSQHQKMADLPEKRIENTPPFTHCGLDCFGPYVIKEGRKEIKKYGLLVTCMFSRAIHIELLDDLTTDAFINGLRTVIAIRGSIRSIKCDRGTNFVGASNELDKSFHEVKEEVLKQFLLENNCEFSMNSPYASHMGGCWERHIRTIRNVLNGMLQKTDGRLDSSSLRTFMYEVMSIVNSRPLNVDNLNDSEGLEAITPNHLITMKSKLMPAPGVFVETDLYIKKRWRKVQFLANQFWQRWRKEYLLVLQQRQKWHSSNRNVKVGDIVLLHDDSVIRGQWKLCRVCETITSEDNLVRRVKIQVGDSELTKDGKRTNKTCILERPVNKITVLLEGMDDSHT